MPRYLDDSGHQPPTPPSSMFIKHGRQPSKITRHLYLSFSTVTPETVLTPPAPPPPPHTRTWGFARVPAERHRHQCTDDHLETPHRRCTEASYSPYQRAVPCPTGRRGPLMLLVYLGSWPGSHMGMALRAALLLLGTGVVRGRGAETPTGPRPRGACAPPPPPQADRVPTGRAHASRKSVGPPRTAGDAHPGQY